MKNFVQDGATIEVTAPYAVSSGGGVLVGSVFGIAVDDFAISVSASIMTEGVFDLVKDTSVFAQGGKVFWDDTNKVGTSTAAGNTFIGRTTQAQLTGDTTVRVMLNEGGNARIFVSAETTGTGSAQNVAHGLGVTPSFILVAPTDLTPSTVGSYAVTEGTHTSTNVVLTVTTSKKFKVIAIA